MKKKKEKLAIAMIEQAGKPSKELGTALTLEEVYRIVVALDSASKALIGAEFECIRQKGYRYRELAGKIDRLHSNLRYYGTSQSFSVKFEEEGKNDAEKG